MAGGSVVEKDDDELVGGSRGALGVLGVVALIGVLGLFSIWWLVFVVGVLIAIFLHETGHFVTARWTGMKATQFFIGFGPRLWSFRRGETEYGVRALPLGAFVRIIGMNNMDEVDPGDEDAHVPVEELPAAAARDLRRVDHAHADRDPAAVHRVRRATARPCAPTPTACRSSRSSACEPGCRRRPARRRRHHRDRRSVRSSRPTTSPPTVQSTRRATVI